MMRVMHVSENDFFVEMWVTMDHKLYIRTKNEATDVCVWSQVERQGIVQEEMEKKREEYFKDIGSCLK